MRAGNIFEGLPGKLDKEELQELASGAGVRIERIVSTGQASTPGFWYDQDADEWVVVLRGSARLEFEGRADLIDMRPGDWVLIAAHQRHRVAWTSPDQPTVWLAVHFDTGPGE